jgi:hypothetical protein
MSRSCRGAPARRQRREAITADGAQHPRRHPALVFYEQTENAGHATDAIADLGKKFGGRAGAQAVQVLGASLKPEAVEWVEEDEHARASSAPEVLRNGALGG